jgi:ABC-type transport system substrate-binding protein
LSAATNRDSIVQTLLGESGRTVSSPLLPSIFGFDAPKQITQYDPEQASLLLEEAGYVKENGTYVKVAAKITGEFKARLKKGAQGTEVRNLQECLANPPAGGPDIYPEAQVTGGFGQLTEAAVIRFQEKYADEILAPSGLKRGTGIVGPSTREKLNEVCFDREPETTPLHIVISTANQFPLQETAQLLKEQWEDIGVTVELLTYSTAELERDVIKSRNYQTLLFGEILGTIPDPFPFWHSSQIHDPGLNLSAYESDEADRLLEKARKETDDEKRAHMYAELQDVILEAFPALFLYDMNYTYIVSNDVRGIEAKVIADPSKRFSGIENWYMKTKRKWK